MTEADWLASTDPQAMLSFLGQQGKLSDRKARLFGCGAVRQVWHLLTDPRLEGAVEIAERYADGLCTGQELESAEKQAHAARFTLDRMLAPEYLVFFAASVVAMKDMTVFSSDCSGRSSFLAGVAAREDGDWKRDSNEVEKARICSLLHDLFGNTFHPLPIDPALLHWNQGLVRHLAQRAFQERQLPLGHLDPDRLAVLADALEEGGADAEMVAHLREPGPHVRGCAVVDLLTGR